LSSVEPRVHTHTVYGLAYLSAILNPLYSITINKCPVLSPSNVVIETERNGLRNSRWTIKKEGAKATDVDT